MSPILEKQTKHKAPLSAATRPCLHPAAPGALQVNKHVTSLPPHLMPNSDDLSSPRPCIYLTRTVINVLCKCVTVTHKASELPCTNLTLVFLATSVSQST